MGRGLSDLQKTTLRVALANRNEHGPDITGLRCDALRAEILAEHFGWEFSGRIPVRERVNRISGGEYFEIGRIGAGRYQSAHASLSRAIERLARRGLVERVWWPYHTQAGINLTPEGVRMAEGLSVKYRPRPGRGAVTEGERARVNGENVPTNPTKPEISRQTEETDVPARYAAT